MNANCHAFRWAPLLAGRRNRRRLRIVHQVPIAFGRRIGSAELAMINGDKAVGMIRHHGCTVNSQSTSTHVPKLNVPETFDQSMLAQSAG